MSLSAEYRLDGSVVRPILLVEERGTVHADDLLALHDGPMVACDCYAAGAERWREVPGDWARDRLVNVDHHAPSRRMEREVSSANLALERHGALGPEPADSVVVLTHTDCDSVLSAGIVSGRLAPEAAYGAAAIAADHTGAEDAIADLLQALDRSRDLVQSFDALARLEAGQAQPPAVQTRVDARRRERDDAWRFVAEERHTLEDHVALVQADARVQGEFFPALLPDAWLIVLSVPNDGPRPYEVKLRRGLHAPPELTLHALRIHDLDPHHGGRWNAGSNRRHGGTDIRPDDYAAWLRQRVRQLTSGSLRGEGA